MNLFEHLDNIAYHKRTWNQLTEEDKKTANMFMLTRFLSMEFSYIDIINEIQTLNLPPQYLYNLYIGVIPKQKKFFKYVKKSVKETEGDNIKMLSKLFKVSEREAKEYLDNLTKEQLETLQLQIEGFKQKKKKK